MVNTVLSSNEFRMVYFCAMLGFDCHSREYRCRQYFLPKHVRRRFPMVDVRASESLPEPVELIDDDLDAVAGGMSARGEYEEEMHESAQAQAHENPRG
jgi:hypothetical protein